MIEYIKDKTNNIDFKFYKFRNENRKIKLQHLLKKYVCTSFTLQSSWEFLAFLK